ncbi:MAG: amidohydrolase family protein [Flaviflexus sp.]|nr:amidohydrolase family protein [Flaviflexus sp.]
MIDAKIYNRAGELIGTRLHLDDGRITKITDEADNPTKVLLPGFVDVHCHGGGGKSFPDDPDLDSIRTAALTHRKTGTTRLVASLVSMADPLPAIEALVEACEAGLLSGIHMEGPYVSPHKAGAQNPAVIREPDLDELASWLKAGKGWILTMTIAPETPGADKAARLLLSHGARPSWGHTVATTKQAREAIAAANKAAEELGVPAPAQTATHLFNAMPGLAHREPGPVRELMAAGKRGECAVEIIGDGVHIDLDLVSDVLGILDDPEYPAGMLITDAMAGAGMPDGDYQLGALAVTIAHGTATLTGTDTIAGGTSTIADQVRLLAKRGADLPMIVRAACLAPLLALHLSAPDIAVGEELEAVLLDENYEVETVWRGGEEVTD